MIDFRYHIVSIVSVFLALALGLFLGSTSLQSTVTHNLKGQANKVLGDNHRLSAANHQLAGSNGALTNFTAAVEPYAVAGQLSGSSVALISAPGVNGGIRKNLTTTLTEAGATVVADIGLNPAFLDSTQDAELGQLARELERTRPLPRQNGAIQAGYVLAHTLLARPGTLAATAGRLASVLSTLSAGKMLSVAGGQLPLHPAQYAVLIVPSGAPTGATPATTPSQDNVLITLARQLRASSSGVVMAGPTIDPDRTGGTLDVARADPSLPKSVSTVDAIDSPAGRIATVIALADASTGRVGVFGLAKHDAPVLSPSPTP